VTSFFQFVLLGLGAGGVYALVSLSVVVVYRGSGIINFASGGIALLGAALYYEIGRHLSTVPAVLISVAVCALVGAIIQLAVMNPMKNSAPISKVVATLGIMTILSNAGALRYGTGGNFILVPSLLPQGVVRIGGIGVGEDRLWSLAIAVVVVGLLYVIYRSTAFGRATTGVAENERAVAALGWSPSRIALVNWCIGSALAGLAGILFAPIVGFSVTPVVLIVLPALSAALIGNFRSFPLAFLGAELVGVLESLSTKYITTPGWTSAVPFLVIVGILVVRGRALPLRGHVFDRLPKIGSAEVVVKRVVIGLAITGVTLALFTPNWIAALTTTIIFGLICLSLVVVTGYAGQLSLAQFAMAGIGAFTATRLADVFHVPFLLALPAAVVVSVLGGMVVALPALRVRGANLAVVTLGLAEVITSVIFGNSAYTGGVNVGTVVPDPKIFGLNVAAGKHPARYAVVALVLLTICALMVSNLRRGKSGRRLLAVRGNERAATSLGINVAGAKLYAFGVSAGLAAVAGVLLGFEFTNVDFSQFSVLTSVQSVLYAVIGGIGYIGGALLGGMMTPNGAIQQILDHWVNLNGATFALIGAIALLPAIIQNRDGIAGAISESWSGWSAKLRARFPGKPIAANEAPLVDSAQRNKIVVKSHRVHPKVLDVKDLRVCYGGTVALDGLDLAVHPGQVVGLIGANGAGKTTFIDAVTGLTSCDKGEVRLGGERVDGLSALQRARCGLARSFQSLELFHDLSVEDNLRTATDSRDMWSYVKDLVRPGRTGHSDIAKAVIAAFDLEPLLKRMPDELPYAQRRLVGIARAVASGPSLLLLDEPASGLDATSTEELARLIRTLATDWGMGILLVEHDVGMVLATSDQVYALDFGCLIGSGTPDEIRRDERVVDAYLGTSDADTSEVAVGSQPRVAHEAAGVLATSGARASGGSVTGVSLASPSELGRPSQPPLGDRGADLGKPLLDVREVCAGYGAIPVIRDLSLRVERGEIVALLGSNGAGKTTTLLTIAGILTPSSGSIESSGRRLPRSLHKRSRAGLGVIFEERGVIPTLSTADNLRLGRGGIDPALEFFPELKPLLSRRAGLLSGGEQQILTVARALAASPELLLIDELSLGLAPMVVERLLKAIRSAADQAAVGVVLVEQRIHTALRYADRASVIHRGEIVLEGSAESLRSRTDEIAERYFEG
jgi:ABC-type branched-subunit amino acid transport system ATPase component/branched-subunit amino acid ABC-type transport system permease component